MLSLERRLRIVDLTHEVQPFSVRDGARLLAGTTPYYPTGTVFLAVVDPGVGSARRAIVARSRRGQYFVLPDNGLLTLVADGDGLDEVREITNPAWLRGGDTAPTFHGRDVLAPVAARLARGDDWRAVGPLVGAPVRIELPVAKARPDGLHGEVIALDGRFGNVVTNIAAAEFATLGYAIGERVRVAIGSREVVLAFARTFADVPPGEPLVYIDSRERVALALNRGSFAQRFGVAAPAPVVVFRKQHTAKGGSHAAAP
jgi:S-adenosylmethionine hydrolase